ncbi:MAG: hypothetical protein AAGG44_15540, partial [Planctomycetota bacterium]
MSRPSRPARGLVVLAAGALVWSLGVATEVAFASGQAASASVSRQDPGAMELLDAEIANLIEDLGSSSYQTRTNAQRLLQDHGLAAFEQLFEAARDPATNVQIANAANYIIQSQDVVWYLDTDSIDVRGYLTGYDELPQSQREKRIQLLMTDGSDDALLALGRLSRYERFDENSQTAAIALLMALAEREQVGVDVWQPLRDTIGDSSRTAAKWISTAIGDLQSGAPDLEAWKKFATEQAATPLPRNPIFVNQLHSRTFRFFTAVCAWVRQIGDRKSALEFGNSCIAAASAQSNIRTIYLCSQIIDVWELPEALVQLHNKKPELFQKDARTIYMLAEAFRKCGLESAAAKQAERASEIVETTATGLGNRVEMIADNRRSIGATLVIRGQFDWAEHEYEAAIDKLRVAREEDDELAKSVSLQLEADELQIRFELAEFLWLGGENAKAAAALKPAIQDRLGDRSETLKQGDQATEQKRITRQILWEEHINRAEASYYFYAGLAAIDEGDFELARKHLRQAIKMQEDNPDIVIAMRVVVDSSEFQELYEAKLTKMRDEFRK